MHNLSQDIATLLAPAFDAEVAFAYLYGSAAQGRLAERSLPNHLA